MILVFGSINLDTIYRLPTLPTPGQTVLGTGASEPGGKGANQAVAAARDGATVAMAGATGRDANAAPALALLRAAGIDLTRVLQTDLPTGTAAICVDPSGENQIAVASGANTLARATQVSDADLGPQTTLLLQHEVAAAETIALAARAHTRGVRVILNLAPATNFDPALLLHIDWLVVNEDEAQAVATHLNVLPDLPTIAAKLCPAAGSGPNIVRTLGAKGVEWTHATHHAHEPAHPVSVVDTTAAGDCFTAIFAAALDRGLSPLDAIRRANHAAALCCTRPGSQRSLPTTSEIEATP